MKQYSPSKNNPWNAKKINLVARRLGFGCSLTDIDLYLNSTPDSLIDDIVDLASSIEVTTAPEWSQWDNKQFNNSEKKQKLLSYDLAETGF